MIVVGRSEDVQDDAPRAKFVDAHRSNVFSTKIHTKGRFIIIFPFLREFPLSCPVKYKEAHTKTNRTALGSHCRAEC